MERFKSQVLADRVLGCWLGKAVGGTLGQTFEGLEGPLAAEFYTPPPTGMVPNDDLDLQVLFACTLDEMPEPAVDRHVLAEAWRRHVAFPWNEYGVAQRNLAEGLAPPHTGRFDNWYTCGEGAAIRSELWACLAPGDPDLAAGYCYEDACFDHDGDGILAAQFLARMQAAAFEESDPATLIDIGLAGLPEGSRLRAAILDTLRWVDEIDDWVAIRTRIMSTYGRSDFTDVRPNTAFVLLGWLKGRTFGERICITNNCGEDTDSSTASLGALLGIIDPEGIDERWLRPIGRQLVLNEEITGITPPPTIDEFARLVERLRERLSGRSPRRTDRPFDAADHALRVHSTFTNTASGSWDIRDQTELPPVGVADPFTSLAMQETTLPGTWVRMSRDDFADRILVVRYDLDGHGQRAVRLMINSSEHFRAWLDGGYLFGAQGSQYMFPAPHMAPPGQYHDFELAPGPHTLTVAIKRPPASREVAEWVVALVRRPGFMWIPNAFVAPTDSQAAPSVGALDGATVLEPAQPTG